jgi:3-dehydro-4-phosphotetronate decarboxylase
VSAAGLPDAVNAAEELEEAAKLFLLLRPLGPRVLDAGQVEDLLRTFG